MNKDNILFSITNYEKIIIELPVPLISLHCCSEASIKFVHNKKNILLSSDSVRENMHVFNNLLTKALNAELKLDSSISQDIGYLYNEELQDRPGLSYKKWEGREYWIGYDYKLWSYKYATWLYNDYKGSIILEITPMYDNLHDDTDDLVAQKKYDNWKEYYFPYFIQNIPHEVAQEWLSQSQKILEIIELNIQRGN